MANLSTAHAVSIAHWRRIFPCKPQHSASLLNYDSSFRLLPAEHAKHRRRGFGTPRAVATQLVVDQSSTRPSLLTWRQDLLRRGIVFCHRRLSGDSPLRQNVGSALLLFATQSAIAMLAFQIAQGQLPWLMVSLIGLSNVILVVRIEQGRGGLRAEKKSQRKLLTQKLIEDVSTALPGQFTGSTEDVRRIQAQVLLTISSNVASFFYDFSKTRTSASLLVLGAIQIDGKARECLSVIARDDPHRQLRDILDVENYIAYKTIKLGWIHATGNIQWEYPQLVGKSYKSVLSLPLKLNGTVIGAVNVESSRRFHFSERELLFQTNLSPYLALLATTFRK